jgi:methoxymalonate biosynthesis acyl carrier protein
MQVGVGEKLGKVFMITIKHCNKTKDFKGVKVMDNIKGIIKNFLSKYFTNYDLKEDEDIFSLGFVNSLFAMQLVMFIEKEFNVTIDNEDLDLKNFSTIKSIAELIERKGY